MRIDMIEFILPQEGIEGTPQPYLKYLNHRCAKSVEGQTYKFLMSDDDKVMMSDTVFEEKSNQPFYDAVEALENNTPDILLIGWGIGFIINKINQLKPDANIYVVEKYQQAIDLTPVPESIHLKMKDVNDLGESDYVEQDFDIVYFDTTEQLTNKEHLESKLKQGGQLLYFRGVKCG